jgi:hypothetical protein
LGPNLIAGVATWLRSTCLVAAAELPPPPPPADAIPAMDGTRFTVEEPPDEGALEPPSEI